MEKVFQCKCGRHITEATLHYPHTCEDSRNVTEVVRYAEGPSDADIMFVGESPGRTEKETSRPFVGRAGIVLNDCCKESGIVRKNVRITNTSHVPYSKGFTDSERLNLLEEIAQVSPKTIIAFGKLAMNCLLDMNGIMKRRGSIYPLKIKRDNEDNAVIHVIPIIHPAETLYPPKKGMPNSKPLIEFDMRRAKHITEHGYEKPSYTFYTFPPRDSLEIANERIHASKKIVVDIEVIHNEFIMCVGIAWNNHESISIKMDSENIAASMTAFRFIDSILRDSSITKTFQFGSYDIFHLIRYGFEIQGKIKDTINMHHCIWSELPHGLDFLCSIYTPQPYYKDAMTSWDTTPYWEKLADYNNTDCVVTVKVEEELEKELAETGLTEVYEKLYPKLQKCTIEMSHKGLNINHALLEEKKVTAKAMEIQFQTELDALAGYHLNVKSPKQVLQALRDCGNAAPSTDKLVLTRLRVKGVKIADLILKVREQRDLISKYLNVKLDEDGRCRCTYSLSTAVTGRLASSKNPLKTGFNLQNVPEDIRDIFIPDDEDHVFVVADESQAEARVTAELAQDPTMLAIFKRGGDVHRIVASMMLSKPESEITKKERDTCKAVVHGSDYGLGPRTLSDMLEIPFARAKFLIAALEETFPMIAAWRRDVAREARDTRMLTNVFGRRRIFLSPKNTEAYAQLPQSTIADWTNICLVELWEKGYDVRLQVHDDIVIHEHKDRAENTTEGMRSIMEREIPVLEIKVPCEISILSTWKKE